MPRVETQEDLVLATLRTTANLIGREHWRRWLLLVVLALVLSGFEMLGAVLVYVLVNLASDPTASIDLPLIGDPRRLFGNINDRSLAVALAASLAAFFVLRAAVRIGTTYVEARVAQNAGARLSNRLVAGYLNAPYQFHLHRNSAELIRNAHHAVSQLVSQVFLPMIRIGAESLLVIGLLTVMVSIAPAASAIAVVVVGGSAAALLFVVQPRLKRLGLVAHATSRETLSLIQQALHGVRDVKLLARERWFARAYSRSRFRMARALYLRQALGELPRTVIELSLIGFILMFLAITISLERGPENTLAVLGLFAYIGLRLQPSIQMIVGGLNSLKFAAAPLEDLSADLHGLDPTPPPEPVAPLRFTDQILLEDVSFRYEGAHVDALSNIDLAIRPGEEIGICGPTGGGKTTLVDLITGLLQPTSGRVTVDGLDVRSNSRSWQRNLGVVPQVVFLLDDTLRRNICLGVTDGEVNDQALQEAVQLAQLHDFVASLPAGLDTTVGERGVRISGGQRQRIAIARALYRRPEVLIFDEGTSALDNTTEAALIESLETLRGRHTIILVAHRLSTVRRSDRVLFVESGSISGEGSYDELMREHASFQVMAGPETR